MILVILITSYNRHKVFLHYYYYIGLSVCLWRSEEEVLYINFSLIWPQGRFSLYVVMAVCACVCVFVPSARTQNRMDWKFLLKSVPLKLEN